MARGFSADGLRWLASIRDVHGIKHVLIKAPLAEGKG